MSKTFYVYSTLANAQRYVNYAPGGADLQQPMVVEGGEPGVFIAGGAGMADKYLRTPSGVMTPVSADQMDYLNECDAFKLHQKNGFITVSDKQEDPEKVVAADMGERDPSAPLVESDFPAGEAPKVAVEEPAPAAGRVQASSRKA